MGVVESNFKSEFMDMTFNINKLTGTVQIFPRVPLEKLYFKSHGSGKIGGVWKEHHESFYNLISTYLVGDVVEIGGGHNSIHGLPIKHSNSYKIFSFDPNGKDIDHKNITVINEFFSEDSLKKRNINNVKLFFHSHLLEHIYDPLKFLRTIHKFIHDEGYHIFAIPNMSKMIQSSFANAMNFEHPFYLDENTIEYLLSLTGFEVVEKKFFRDDHSIFYKTKKIEPKNVSSFNFYNENKQLFKNLISSWISDTNKINKKINDYDGKVYIFGAHIFSQNIIFNGLNSKRVSSVLDNDPEKQGYYLYGTNLLVNDPNIIIDDDNPLVILRAAAYNDEIKRGLLSINSSTKFV